MAPPARGDWRTGGFDLSATQPASPDEKIGSKDAPKAASKLREPRLHMRGLLAKRGSALLDPQRRKPTSDARLVFRSAEEAVNEEEGEAGALRHAITHARHDAGPRVEHVADGRGRRQGPRGARAGRVAATSL